MGTSTIATSRVATALAVVGLTVALAGAAAQQPAQDEGSRNVVITTDAPATGLAPDGQVPVQLAVAETGEAPFAGRGAVDRLEETGRRAAENELLRCKYDVIDFKELSATEQKIRAALDEDTVLEFIETPLDQVIQFLKEMHDIPIEIDTRALDDYGIGTDVPITRNLKGITLRSALRLLLADLELTYIIKHEVLIITTTEVADAHVETHVYSLHRLGDVDSEALAKVIQNTIRSDTWRTSASPDKPPSSGDAKAPKTPRLAAIEALPGCLVIKQSQHAHEEITDLLAQFERFATSMEMLQRVSDD
ncbi:MAG: hypothetical protein H8E44_03480 [Planctomycetes bacterium]|nr:hypothetical protein [Planctomycetota bacterium]MBL7038665.1 hypothetical protein [Pirellulaceae bacterium]